MMETNDLVHVLKDILFELRSQKQVLGFGHAPRPRYIYANRQYSDCLWYFWNGAKSEHEPIEFHALTGVIEKLEIEEREFRGKPDYKVNLLVRADRAYIIQSGLDTLFARGLIFTLSKLPTESFRQPITIAVEPGDTDQVLFCKIYDPVTGQAFYEPCPQNIDWQATLQHAIANVAAAYGSRDRAPIPQKSDVPKPVKPTVQLPQKKVGSWDEPDEDFRDRLAAIREFTSQSNQQIQTFCKMLGITPRSATEGIDEFLALRRSMLIAWGCDFPCWNHDKHCENSFDKLWAGLAKLGNDDKEFDQQLMNAWKEKVQSKAKAA